MVKFTSESIWCWAFLHCEIFDYWFKLLLVIGIFRFSISSWLSVRKLAFLRIFPFLLGCPVCWCIVFPSFFLSFFLFFFMAAPIAHGSSQARGWIRVAAGAYAPATAIPHLTCLCDLCHSLWQHQIFNLWVRPGIKPTCSQRQHQVLNLLSHNRNSSI